MVPSPMLRGNLTAVITLCGIFRITHRGNSARSQINVTYNVLLANRFSLFLSLSTPAFAIGKRTEGGRRRRMLPLCDSSPKKFSHGALACLPNADSSLSGVAPLGFVKGSRFSGFASRRATPHPKQTRLFQGFRVNARQTAPCASDETSTSRVSRCVHTYTSRDEGKTSAPTRG